MIVAFDGFSYRKSIKLCAVLGTISLAQHFCFFSVANNKTEIFKWPVFDVSPCIYMVQRVRARHRQRHGDPTDFGSFSAPRERRVGVRRSYVIDCTLSLGFKTFTLVSALRFHPIPVRPPPSPRMFTAHVYRFYASLPPEISIQDVVYERRGG